MVFTKTLYNALLWGALAAALKLISPLVPIYQNPSYFSLLLVVLVLIASVARLARWSFVVEGVWGLL